MKKIISIYKLLVLIVYCIFCLHINTVEAKVCFLAGSNGANNCAGGSENEDYIKVSRCAGYDRCEFPRISAISCDEDDISLYLPEDCCSPNSFYEECPSPKVCGGTDCVTRYRPSPRHVWGEKTYCEKGKCYCPSEYKYTDDDDKYEYSNACDDKYEKKICKAEFTYVYKEDISRLSDSGFNPVQACEGDLVPNTSSETCYEEYNNVNVRRYKSCKCDTSKYKYSASADYGYVGTVFKKGTECSVSGFSSAYMTPTCSGNQVNGYYYRQACNDDTEIEVNAEKKVWRSAVGSESVTCRACKVKTCTDIGGSSSPIKGYRIKTVTLNGNICYTKDTLCQPGDYAIKGGYCYQNASDVTATIETALEGLNTSKEYKLGVVTKATKSGDEKVVLRVVAERDAHMMSPDGKYYYGTTDTDAYTESSPESITHTAYETDTTNWGIMTNEDVDAILTNSTVNNRVFYNAQGQHTFKSSRSNLFAIMVDQTNSSDSKLCAGNSKTINNYGATDAKKYAYADIYQCYWVKHNSDSKVDRAVMDSSFTGIASKTNKWPRYSNGPHIYMRKNTGHNDKPAYQNYVWYTISSLNQLDTDYCATTRAALPKYQKQDANYSKITLEDIIFGREGSGKCTISNAGVNYIPLTYGARYYEEVEGTLLQRNPELPTAGSKWPYGVQPWRIAAMYAGECSDSESKAGACRDDGNGFSCNMRMYWHGAGFICPYSLQGNGSKEPTERCFSNSLYGSGEYWYFGDQTTQWDYRSKASHSGSLEVVKGGYKFDNEKGLADYYKTGVQGCFVRPAVTLTVTATTVDDTSDTGNTFKPDLSDFHNRLSDNQSINTEALYNQQLSGEYNAVKDIYSNPDIQDEEGFNLTDFMNKYKVMNQNMVQFDVKMEAINKEFVVAK